MLNDIFIDNIDWGGLFQTIIKTHLKHYPTKESFQEDEMLEKGSIDKLYHYIGDEKGLKFIDSLSIEFHEGCSIDIIDDKITIAIGEEDGPVGETNVCESYILLVFVYDTDLEYITEFHEDC